MASLKIFRTTRRAPLAGPGPVSGGQQTPPVLPAFGPALPGGPSVESTLDVFTVPANLLPSLSTAGPELPPAVRASAALENRTAQPTRDPTASAPSGSKPEAHPGAIREILRDSGSVVGPTADVSAVPSGEAGPEVDPWVAAWQGAKTTESSGPPVIETGESVAAERVPPPGPSPIAIIRPRDGDLIPPEAPPVLVVEGQVADHAVSTIWLVVNDARIAVPILAGRFRQIVPAAAPVLRVWAETSPDGGLPRRSEAVTVRAAAPRPASAILVIDWPQEALDLQMEVSAIWRPRPDLLDGPGRPVPMDAFGVSRDNFPPEVFSLANPAPGVYTFVLSYQTSSSVGEARPTLFLQDHGSLGVRSLRPVSLAGTGRAVLARILLPQGVLWEHDWWFTGRSDSADTVTKFRFPEGISWIERRVDLR